MICGGGGGGHFIDLDDVRSAPCPHEMIYVATCSYVSYVFEGESRDLGSKKRGNCSQRRTQICSALCSRVVQCTMYFLNRGGGVAVGYPDTNLNIDIIFLLFAEASTPAPQERPVLPPRCALAAAGAGAAASG